MAKYAYPAIFEEDEGSIAVVFPDLKNCYTQGEDMVDALEMASDVLSGKLVFMEDNGEEIPKPTPISELEGGRKRPPSAHKAPQCGAFQGFEAAVLCAP